MFQMPQVSNFSIQQIEFCVFRARVQCALILGSYYADMPPLNVFLPENANRINLVKKIYSVCKKTQIFIHKQTHTHIAPFQVPQK